MPQRRVVNTRMKIVEAIQQFRASHGYSPTVRELGAMVQLSSSNSVHKQLARLEREGVVQRVPGKARCLLVVEHPCQ